MARGTLPRAVALLAAMATGPAAAWGAEAARPRLDPLRRTYMLMALLGLTLLGILLVLLVSILARQVRRNARKRQGPTPLERDDLWYRKPLVPEVKETDGREEDEQTA